MYDDEEDSEYEAEVMGGSAEELQNAVIGHRIVSVEKLDREKYPGGSYSWRLTGVVLTLDDGTRVEVVDTDDCCAYTSIEQYQFLADTDNAVTSVTTEDGFSKWFIYAGGVPVVSMDVGWSPGNPYFYGFGFEINVQKEN